MSIERARLVCKIAHSAIGQRRRYTGEPYHHHPYAVAQMLADARQSSSARQAAYLHDVVEDTGVDLDMIYAEFGWDVGELVRWVTDPKYPKDMNRKARKAADRERLRDAPPEAKTIKLADLIDNTYSIVKHDKNFAVVYLREKRLLLDVLRGGDQGLWDKAYAVLEWGEKELNRPYFNEVSAAL